MPAAEHAATGTVEAPAPSPAALDRLREGFAVFDSDLRLTGWNGRFAKLGGYPAELLRPGTPYLDLARFEAVAAGTPESDLDRAAGERAARLARRDAASFDEARPDGTELSVTIVPLPDGGVLLSIFDMTDRAAVERQLRQDQEVLRVIADEAPVYLNLVDEKGSLTYANRTALAFVGRSLEDIRGFGWESHHHPDDLPRNQVIFDEAYRRQQTHQVEFRIRRHDGQYRWMREIAVARFAPDGTFLGFICSSEDITDAKAAQEELARQREALHQSEKLNALGSLLAGVAHELNNPLSVVSGQAQLLAEMAPDPKTAERAELIKAAAESCAKIVKSFLAMARRRPPQRSAVEVNRIVESGLEVLGYALRTAGVEVELDLADDLPTSWADGDQLEQVMANLIVNAQQAMAGRDGARRLRIATRFDAEANRLRLEVDDSGPGVPAAMRSRIFEPFFTTKSAGVGTGIGLSLCHNIVEAHGGTIAVEDAPGGGARFVVLLPQVHPQDAPSASPAARAFQTSAPRLPLLVVDDEIPIARTLADILEATGYDVDIAADGIAALKRIQARDYRLVLSDLRMPGLDGPGLYRALQARDPGWPQRMIFVTGDTLSEAAAEFLRKARRPCIEKPFNTQEVRRVVADALDAAARPLA